MALKMQADYGDAVQILFVESQGASPDAMERFALARKWLGGRAMWTTERAVSSEAAGIPAYALISPEGEIVMRGLTGESGHQAKKALDEMVKSARKAPKDAPKELARAIVDARVGDHGKALAAVEAVLADDKAQGVHDEARALRAEVQARVDGMVKRIGWMFDNGHPLEGTRELAALQKAIQPSEHAKDAIAELAQRAASDEMKAELEAARALAKPEERLYADGPNDKSKKAIEKVVEKYGATKVGARARALVALCG